jgi:hypothetical protein
LINLTVTIETGKVHEAATAGTIALNVWKASHMVEGTFACHIQHIGHPHPSWQARNVVPAHAKEIEKAVMAKETCPEHIIMLATAKSKDKDGNFNLQLAIDKHDLAPMTGNHSCTALRNLHREETYNADYSEGLRACFENVQFRVLFVDTEVRVICHSFALQPIFLCLLIMCVVHVESNYFG